VLDLDAFDRNLDTMARIARERGVALRPHAKTHKCATIGRRQMAAGAAGLCCAKLGEAEAMAAAGLDHLLLTSPIVDQAKIERLLVLNLRLTDLAVVVDDPANVSNLAEAAARKGQVLNVLIDVDIGTHRFGVPSVDAAVDLARAIAERPSLRFMGLQGYAGHAMHVPLYAERRRASHAALGVLAAVRNALATIGLGSPIVTGGGTGTHDFDHEARVLTDLQVGSYVFCDVEYDEIELTAGGGKPFEDALFVHTRIVSAHHPGFATSDAGSKSFAMDGPAPAIVAGAPKGSTYGRFGDEFGRIILPDPRGRLALGTLIVCVVPHCDPTVNLYDFYHCVRADQLVDIWPIEARGCAT
jgi:D-serine deaminase-like pyridoxal phosphate-dependent protein